MNRNLTHSRVLNRGEVVICGSFAPNGAGPVDALSNIGIGWSVARSGVGSFTVTLDDKCISLISGQAHLQLASPDDKIAQLGSIDVASARTVVISVWDISAAAVADVAADPNNRIHFTLRLKNSTVK